MNIQFSVTAFGRQFATGVMYGVADKDDEPEDEPEHVELRSMGERAIVGFRPNIEEDEEDEDDGD